MADVIGFECVVVNLLMPHGDFEAVTVVGPARDHLLGSRNNRQEFIDELACADDWGLLRFVPGGRYQDPEGAVVWHTDEPPLKVPDAWRHDDALYAPLRDQHGELLGILSLDLPVNRRRPGSVRRRVLEMYVVQIALAISLARERFRLEEQVRIAGLISTITSLSDEDPGLSNVLESSRAALEDGLRANGSWIRLFADEREAWDAVNVPKGLAEDLHTPGAGGAFSPLDVERVFAMGARLATACWTQRRTLVVSADEASDTSAGLVGESSRARSLEWLGALGHAEFVLVPIGAAARCAGYFVVSRTAATGTLTPAEDRAALEVGRELGRVIDHTRLRHRQRELVLRLEDLDVHRNQVITTVVHELKNPLAAIMGSLEMVEDDPSVAERAHAAIGAASARMLALVQDMLTLTRLKETSPAMRQTEVDLSAVVRDAVAQLADTAERSGVRLDLSGVLPGVRLGPRRRSCSDS